MNSLDLNIIEFLADVPLPNFQEINEALLTGKDHFDKHGMRGNNPYFLRLKKRRCNISSDQDLNEFNDYQLVERAKKAFSLFESIARDYDPAYPVKLVQGNLKAHGGPFVYKGVSFSSFDGHHRLVVAKALGIETIPAVTVDLSLIRTPYEKPLEMLALMRESNGAILEYTQTIANIVIDIRKRLTEGRKKNISTDLMWETQYPYPARLKVVIVGAENPVGAIFLAQALPHTHFIAIGNDEFVKQGTELRDSLGAHLDNLFLLRNRKLTGPFSFKTVFVNMGNNRVEWEGLNNWIYEKKNAQITPSQTYEFHYNVPQRRVIPYPLFVNHRDKFIFRPIPKVATTSLYLWYLGTLGLNSIPVRYPLHGFLYVNKEFFWVLDQSLLENEDYFKFVFIRNPFARLVSAYLGKIVLKESNFQNITMNSNGLREIEHIQKQKGRPINHEKGVTFREFVEYLTEVDPLEMDPHWRPQSLYWQDKIFGELHFDFVGRIENMIDDFALISKRLKIDIPLSKSNCIHYDKVQVKCVADCSASELRQMGQFPVYQDFYTTELVQQVKQIYQKDIELYGSKLLYPLNE